MLTPNSHTHKHTPLFHSEHSRTAKQPTNIFSRFLFYYCCLILFWQKGERFNQKQEEMRAVVSGIFWSMLFICTLHQVRFSLANGSAAESAAAVEEMVPMMEPGKTEMMVMFNESRRKLGSFQICALCTCCGGGNKNYCLASPCCYAINCNIPNRPFGFCSFTPQTCNCFGCHI